MLNNLYIFQCSSNLYPTVTTIPFFSLPPRFKCTVQRTVFGCRLQQVPIKMIQKKHKQRSTVACQITYSCFSQQHAAIIYFIFFTLAAYVRTMLHKNNGLGIFICIHTCLLTFTYTHKLENLPFLDLSLILRF